MASLNKVILMGYLCADPELKKTPTGTSVCSFRLGVARRYKDAEGNTVSDFITCVAWRGCAEFVARYFKKGTAAVVCGALQSRAYTDAQGSKRYIVEVVADEVNFGEAKRGGDVQTPSDADVPPSGGHVDVPNFEPLGTDESLPF